MYVIKCDGKPIYDLRNEDLVVFSPSVKLETNTVGECTFVIYSSHPYYNDLRHMKSVFEVEDDEGVIFRGRMTKNSRDFNNGKDVDIEGALAYFNDSKVRPFNFPEDVAGATASTNMVEAFLKWLIENHNSQVQDYQKFKLGNVTVYDNYIVRSDEAYKSTWEVLKEKLFESALGGYLCIRYEFDGNYIDYLADFEEVNEQEIRFGKNLLDFRNETDASETYSAIIPLGADIEIEQEGEEATPIKKKLTLENIPDGEVGVGIFKRGDTLYSTEAVEQYGWIYAPTSVTTWSDVTEDTNLLNRGVEFFTAGIMMNDSIEISAVDTHLTDSEIQSFRINKKVRVVTNPHGIAGYFKLTRIEIPLAEPQNTKLVVGEKRKTLTETVIESNDGKDGQNGISVLGAYRYYLLKSSGSAPAQPDTYPPTDEWSETEPSYTSGNGKLYFVDCTVYSNGAFRYSPVSLSTSYEAANEAKKVATNYMNFAGIHGAGLVIGDLTKSVLGRNVHIASERIDLRDGQTVLASYTATQIQLGKSTEQNLLITTDGVNIRSGANVVASFETNKICLGKNSFSSTIDLLNGVGTIHSKGGKEDGDLFITSRYLQTQGDIVRMTSTINDDTCIASISCGDIEHNGVAKVGIYVNGQGANSGKVTSINMTMDKIRILGSEINIGDENCTSVISGDSISLQGAVNATEGFDGEQKFYNSDYCKTITDTAVGVGCAFKASRGLFNEALIDKLIMTTGTGKLPIYKFDSGGSGAMRGLAEVAHFTTNGTLGCYGVSVTGTISTANLSVTGNTSLNAVSANSISVNGTAVMLSDKIITGTYVYNGSSTATITIEHVAGGKNYAICTCQDAGEAVARVKVVNGSNLLVTLTGAVTLARINYILF